MFHQFYLTHCTYASSALERRRDEMAVHPLGYSVRGGSVKGPGLREAFRRLERYVYYYLPVDTPPEEKEIATPHTAPVRLFYFHTAEGNRVAGQVVYREKDTAGRTGSYFAHVLMAPQAKDAGGEILDVLGMWGASGWETQDGEHLAHDIPPLAGLRELAAGSQPAIQEMTLAYFLTEKAGGAFRDPGNIIPARWRRMSTQRRQAFFLNALAGLLAVLETQNAPLILVAEPEMAALMFYGLLRFLPKNITRDMSFSTYEPQPERVFTKMAATTFFAPEVNDMREDMYRGNAFVLNTFTGRMSHQADAPATNGGMITEGGPAFRVLKTPYIQRIFQDFLQGGMPAVDRYCANLETVGAASVVDLDAMGEVETYVNAILPGSFLTPVAQAAPPESGPPPVPSPPVPPPPVMSPPVPPELPPSAPDVPELPFSYGQMKIASSRMATAYLRRRLVERLAKVQEPEKSLAPLPGTPRHSLLLELLGVGTEEPHVRAAMQFLIGNMQEAQIPLWLRNAPVPEELRARVLDRWIQAHGTLPAGCEFLWQQVADYFAPHDAHSETPQCTLAALLPVLDETRLRNVFAQAAQHGHGCEFLMAFSLGISQVMERLGPTAPAVMEARSRLDALVQDVPVETLLAVYTAYGNRFFADYPGNAETLGGVLQALEPQLLNALEHKDAFLAKYHLLADAQETLPPDVRKKTQAWQTLLRTVESVVKLQPDPKIGKKAADLKVLDHACKEMTFAAMNVLAPEIVHTLTGGQAEVAAPPQKSDDAKVVMVAKPMPKDFTLAERQRIAREQMRLLRKIAGIAPGAALLPAEAWQNAQLAKKVENAFMTQVWSLKKVGRFAGADKATQNKVLIVVGGTCMGLVAAVLWFLLSGGMSGGGKTGGESAHGPDENAPVSAAVQDNTPETTKAGKTTKTTKTAKAPPPVEEEEDEEYEEYEEEIEDPASVPDVWEDNGDENGAAGDFPEDDGEVSVPAVRKPELTSRDTLAAMHAALKKEGTLVDVRLTHDPKNLQKAAKSVISEQLNIPSRLFQRLELRGGYLLYNDSAYPFGGLAEQFPGPLNRPADEDNGTAAPVGPRSHVLRADTLLDGTAAGERAAVRDIPGKRYDIPQLARVLGLARVIVELEPVNQKDGVAYLTLEGIPRPVTELEVSELANHEEKLDLRTQELHILRTQLKTCESLAQKPGVKLDDAMAKLVKYLDNTPLPPAFQDKPEPGDYATPQAYQADVQSWTDARTARESVISRFLQAAREEADRRENEIKKLETTVVRVRENQTPAEAEALAGLYGEGRLRVAVYVPDGAAGGDTSDCPFRMHDALVQAKAGGAAPFSPVIDDPRSADDILDDMLSDDPFGADETKEIGEEIPEEDIPEDERVSSDVRLLSMTWKCTERRYAGVRAGEKAYFYPRLMQETGKTQTRVLGNYLVRCEYRMRMTDKTVLPGTTITDVSTTGRQTAPLVDGCEEMAFRLVFYPKQGNDLMEESAPPAFRTRWFYVAPITKRTLYEIEAALTPEASALLRNKPPIIVPKR